MLLPIQWGYTALFNALTGSRQKVANYAGVTVERKEGRFTTPAGKALFGMMGVFAEFERGMIQGVDPRHASTFAHLEET